MTPVDERAYIYFQQHHEPPPYQQQFTSIVYSLENSVPVLRLWQDSAWTPDRSRPLLGTLVGFVADFLAIVPSNRECMWVDPRDVIPRRRDWDSAEGVT